LDDFLAEMGLDANANARLAATRTWAREAGFTDVNTALRTKFPGIASFAQGPQPDFEEEVESVEDDTPKVDPLADIVPTGVPYWYEAPEDTQFLEDFISIRQNGKHDGNLIVTGAAGSGKTEGIIRLADRLGIPIFKMNCAVVSNIDMWVGSKEVTPERGTYFEPSDHLIHMEATEVPPGMMLYDEVNRMTQDVANFLLPILDDQKEVWSPAAGRVVKMHPDNIVIATMNQGSGYSGTFHMDWALRDRFGYSLERTFPPELDEIKILVTRTGIEAKLAQQIVRVAQQSRNAWERETIDTPISTRAAIHWAMIVAHGTNRTIRDAAEHSIIPQYRSEGGNESDRAKIRLMLEGKSVT
jgi:MoxR-like ATPase